MTLIVEITSQETVKPSSPTPHHLRTMNFSLLDQYTPSIGVPVIMFYSVLDKNTLTPDRIKTSLSENLTLFYPFAGRINGNDFILCNDEGVTFFEARVYTHLSQIVSHPLEEELHQLLPKGNPEDALLCIQLNIFDCGGIAIAVCMSHKLGDASSLALFLNSWASLGRGGAAERPIFDQTSLFSPNQGTSAVNFSIPTEKVICKRFVFDACSIASLRSKCSNKAYVEHPTKVEAVSALIWKSCVVNSMSIAVVPVDLRSRLVPPLRNSYVGNLCVATVAAAEIHPELHVLAGLLHKSIAKIGGDYVKNLKTKGGFDLHMKYFHDMMQKSCNGNFLWISSWCRFPFYEADFGMGKPVWVCPVVYLENILILMDTNCGKGVEAWVAFNKEDMNRFESCLELSDVLMPNQI